MPIWVIAVNAAPGSSQPKASPTIRRCALEEIGRNSVSPWTTPEDDGFEPAHAVRPRGSGAAGGGRWRAGGTRGHSRARLCPRRGGPAARAARRPASPACPRVAPESVGAPVGWPVVEQRALGRSGLVVSRLALGTMTWGRDTDEDEAAMQLTAFVDAGGTLVDTADVYCDGESERTLGHLLTDVVPRSDVLIATKAVGRTGPGRWAAARPAGTCSPRWTPRWSASARLRRPLAAARLGRRDAARGDAGRLRPRRLLRPGPVRRGQQLHRLADRAGRDLAARLARPHAAGQHPGRVLAAAARRGARGRARPREALGLGVLAWSPLGRGILTGKYRHSTPSESRGASPQWQGFIDGLRSAKSRPDRRGGDHRGRGLGARPLAVALAWVRDRPGVVAPIVGARTAQQLQASLDADGRAAARGDPHRAGGRLGAALRLSRAPAGPVTAPAAPGGRPGLRRVLRRRAVARPGPADGGGAARRRHRLARRRHRRPPGQDAEGRPAAQKAAKTGSPAGDGAAAVTGPGRRSG